MVVCTNVGWDDFSDFFIHVNSIISSSEQKFLRIFLAGISFFVEVNNVELETTQRGIHS